MGGKWGGMVGEKWWENGGKWWGSKYVVGYSADNVSSPGAFGLGAQPTCRLAGGGVCLTHQQGDNMIDWIMVAAVAALLLLALQMQREEEAGRAPEPEPEPAPEPVPETETWDWRECFR